MMSGRPEAFFDIDGQNLNPTPAESKQLPAASIDDIAGFILSRIKSP